MRFCRQSARFKNGLFRLARLARLVIATGCCALRADSVLAEAPSSESAETAWRVVVVAKFSLPEVSQPIPGAKDTVFAAAWISRGGETKNDQQGETVRLMHQSTFNKLGLDWAAFSAKAAAAASAELAKLQPELIRDSNQVIECAILHAPPATDDITTIILAPDFLKRFTPIFGRKMLIAIPDRQTVYVFPKLTSRYQDYAERVLAVYHKSKCPVTREVFELSATGLRAIGQYEE